MNHGNLTDLTVQRRSAWIVRIIRREKEREREIVKEKEKGKERKKRKK